MPDELPDAPLGYRPRLSAEPGTNLTIPQMLGIPPQGGERDEVISRVKHALSSTDEKTRNDAQRYVDKYGRNMFMVGLNKATQFPFSNEPGKGLSQQLAELGQTGGYSPEAYGYANELSKATRPNAYSASEAVGTLVNLLPYLIAMRGRPGSPGGTPPPLSPGGGPLGPGGGGGLLGPLLNRIRGQDQPPGPMPQLPEEPMPGLPPGFPKFVEDTRASGLPREPSNPADVRPMERAYNRELDKGLPGVLPSPKNPPAVERAIKPDRYAPSPQEVQRILERLRQLKFDF